MCMDEGVYCEQYQRTAELIGSRWTAAIIRALLGGVHQFSALRAAIPGISDRMLSERLRELEQEGIVSRRVQPHTPVRVTYELTEKGEALSTVVDAIIDWLAEWGDADPTPLRREESSNSGASERE